MKRKRQKIKFSIVMKLDKPYKYWGNDDNEFYQNIDVIYPILSTIPLN